MEARDNALHEPIPQRLHVKHIQRSTLRLKHVPKQDSLKTAHNQQLQRIA
jgi:hypothetical protein